MSRLEFFQYILILGVVLWPIWAMFTLWYLWLLKASIGVFNPFHVDGGCGDSG